MTIEEKVYALLAANAGVTAIVPTADILPPGDWQNLNRPYIVHFPVTTTPVYAEAGRVALNEWLYQVSSFCDTYGHARQLSQAVQTALSGQHDGIACFWTDQTHQFEPDVRVHQIALTFRVFETL